MSNKFKNILPLLALLFVKLAILLFAVINREDNAPVLWGELKIILFCEVAVIVGILVYLLWFIRAGYG